ncbi:unnamed protein product [Mytilus coruscus]|uniref:Endonuclease/exonuclease/phosphatase domain-containing protein n=1 Tax=Mytilus coruscus TaxID=42192 RepID=A0A6J8CSU4_MYTCO|nr:unnamed protein product [Mytilus coruscus]
MNDSNFLVFACYLPPENSSRGRDAPSFFAHLLAQIYLNDECGAMWLTGDFHSRIGSLPDKLNDIDCVPMRNTIDKRINQQDGYDTHQVSRKDQRGGGLPIVYQKNLDVKLVKNDCQSTHFELIECKIAIKNQHFRLGVIYRPPPSTANKFRNSIIFEEWSRFLDRTVVVSEELIITGDLNFHLDDPTDNDAHKFLETLEEHGLSQHVAGKTHVHGHNLDVVITRKKQIYFV